MNNICRVCLKSENLVCLFRSQNAELPDKIMFCASVHVMPGDNLPSQICAKCVDHLNISYDFKLLCERSDWILRRNAFDETNQFSNRLDVKDESNSVELRPDVKCEDENINNSISFNQINGTTNYEQFLNDDIISANAMFQLKTSQNIDTVNKECKGIAKILGSSNKTKKDDNNQNLSSIEDNNDALSSVSDDVDYDKNHSDTDHASQNFPLKKRHKMINKQDFKTEKKKNNKSDKNHKVQCVTCGKVISSRFRLKMHMRIHTGEKPFTCKYCNKTFSLSQNLKVHERVHTGEKPLVCGNCGKGFAQSSALIAHIRLHTGETPYKCTLCPMSFRTPGHLQYHIKQHTGEKNYECKVCNKAFIAKGDLTQHSKTHTGERPFICTICGLRMSRSSHLTRHMITHTGKKPHSCNSCGSSYAQKGDLARHIKRFRDGSCKIADSISIRRWNEMCSKKKTSDDIDTENVNAKFDHRVVLTNNVNS